MNREALTPRHRLQSVARSWLAPCPSEVPELCAVALPCPWVPEQCPHGWLRIQARAHDGNDEIVHVWHHQDFLQRGSQNNKSVGLNTSRVVRAEGRDQHFEAILMSSSLGGFGYLNARGDISVLRGAGILWGSILNPEWMGEFSSSEGVCLLLTLLNPPAWGRAACAGRKPLFLKHFNAQSTSSWTWALRLCFLTAQSWTDQIRCWCSV